MNFAAKFFTRCHAADGKVGGGLAAIHVEAAAVIVHAKQQARQRLIGSGPTGADGNFAIRLWQLPMTLTAGNRPFVILAKDKRAESRHGTLADAIKTTQSGDTIEVHGDGPIAAASVGLGKMALTIRASAGFQHTK